VSEFIKGLSWTRLKPKQIDIESVYAVIKWLEYFDSVFVGWHLWDPDGHVDAWIKKQLAYPAGKEKTYVAERYAERFGSSRIVQNVHFIAKYDNYINASLLMDSSPFLVSEKTLRCFLLPLHERMSVRIVGGWCW
jgi:hypothetical protein